MQANTGEKIVVMTAVPADLRAALLGAGHTLVPIADLPAGPLPGYRVGLSSAMTGATRATFERLPDMKLLASSGTGLDLMDLQAARDHGCAILNTPDVLTEDTADFAIALLYGIARKVVEGDRFVRSGAWAKGRLEPSTRLLGKTCGVFGLGRIGQAVARRAQGIGMKVIWSGPRPKPEAPWAYVPTLDALAEQSDVLVLCCPGGPETADIVDTALLKKIGPAGFLINVARGGCVVDEDLMAALRDGTIRGAASDVFRKEPNLDPRLLEVPNFVVAPHFASLTYETRVDIVGMLVNGIAAFREGRPHHDATKD